MVELSRSYLTEQTTLEDIMRSIDFAHDSGEFVADWKRLQEQKQQGDEFWRFAPPPGAIPLWGIALVRNGKVVATLIEAVG